MKKPIEVKRPEVSEWLYYNNGYTTTDGTGEHVTKPTRFHITELTEEEAKEYAEEYKTEFMKMYHEKRMLTNGKVSCNEIHNVAGSYKQKPHIGQVNKCFRADKGH